MEYIFKPALLVTFSVISFSASAQTRPAVSVQESTIESIEQMIDSLSGVQESKIVTKKINLTEKFRCAEISGNVTLFLTNDSVDTLLLTGDSNELDNIKVVIKNGELKVSSKGKTTSKPTVHLPVAELSSLIIDGDSEIFSFGTITTKNLQIILTGTSMVLVRYHGRLNVLAAGLSELIDIEEYRKLVSRK